MRDIKFRAWDHKKKLMVVQDNTDRIDKCLHYYEVNKKVSLMQYTGLSDKNDVYIFDGDIVKDRHGFNKTVYFDNSAYFLRDHDVSYLMYEYCKDYIKFNFGRCENLEVIGNIYENKELRGVS